MNKEKYLKWYKLAQEIVNNSELIPERTDKEILDLVSQEDWLMFLIKELSDMKEAKNADKPNVFFSIFRDDNRDYGRIGVTFNNVPAVDILKNILNKYCKDEKEKLTELLLSFDGTWEIKVKRKIKEHHWQETPRYVSEIHVNCNEINEKIVDQIINLVNKIREEGKENRKTMGTNYMETPSVSLVETTFELSEEEFSKRTKEAFEVLEVCLNVKSEGEIKKIVKSKNSELEELKKEKEALESRLEKFRSFSLTPPGEIKKMEIALEEVKKRIKELEEELNQ